MLIMNHVEYKCLYIIFDVYFNIFKQIILRFPFLNIWILKKSENSLKEIPLESNHKPFIYTILMLYTQYDGQIDIPFTIVIFNFFFFSKLRHNNFFYFLTPFCADKNPKR